MLIICGSPGWWQQVLVIWVLGRVFTTAVILTIARQQGPNPWSPSRPGYLDYIDGWDSGWYRRIYANGYPSSLTRDADGVQPDQWALLPLFPYVVRFVSGLTNLSWQTAAPAVASLSSLAACLLLYQLFRSCAGAGTSLFGVTLFSFQPAAMVLQIGYAESLALLLLIAILLCLTRKRYWQAVPLILVLALCRPMQAPLALTMVLLLLWHVHDRRREPIGKRTVLGMWVATVACCLSVLIWPVVAAITTGEVRAYFEVEASWHGKGSLIPGVFWALIGVRMFGTVFGLIAPVLFGLAVVMLLLTEAVRGVGKVMWIWTASYVVYVIWVAAPNGGIFRLLMPAFPLFVALGLTSNSRAYRVSLLVLAMLGQVVWVTWLWQWTGLGLHGALETHP